MIGRHAGHYHHNGEQRRSRSANSKIAGANSRAAFVPRDVSVSEMTAKGRIARLQSAA